MKVNITSKRLMLTAVSATVLMTALLVIGVVLGAQIATRNDSQSPMKLMAETSARGKNVSMATGLVDQDMEGLFILDHLNGNLQCWVINLRNNEIGGIFRTNIFDALPALKQGADLDFVLTTGFVNFQNRGNQVPARSIAYVAEGKSGGVAGFSFQFNKAAIQRGQLQEGALELIVEGPIRDLQLRDQ